MLFEVYRTGGAAALRAALAEGADPNEPDFFGYPILSEVAAAKDQEAVRLLLDAGADADRAPYPGAWTPLFFAAGAGSLEVVRILVARGANPLAISEEGYTPYGRTSPGDIDVREFFREIGADKT